MKRRVATLLCIALSFVIAGALPGSATPPIKVPGGVPIGTLTGNQPGALTTDALGGPSQAPLNLDTKVQGTLRPVQDKTRPTIAHKVLYKQMVAGECSPRWVYDITGTSKKQFKQGNNPLTIINNNGSTTVKYWVESSAKGSVAFGVNGAIEVQTSVILSSVKAKFGWNFQASYGWEEIRRLEVPVPAHSTYSVSYGVMRLITQGHYYYVNEYCEITRDKGTITTASPYAYYWNIDEN